MMKRMVLVALLFIVGLSFAQSKILYCQEKCCAIYKGTYQVPAGCSLGPADAAFEDYLNCQSNCIEQETGIGSDDYQPTAYDDVAYDGSGGQAGSSGGGFCGVGAIMLALIGVGALKI